MLPRRLRDWFANTWELEFANLHLRLMFCSLLARVLPIGRATRLRALLIRLIGPPIGAGTRFSGMPIIQTSPPRLLGSKLRIGAECSIGARVILEFGESVSIGDRVSLADGVAILTTTHQLGPKEHRAGPAVRYPVHIGDDVQIGLDAIILPGTKIGSGARVLANSVVNASVAPGMTVGGNPARPVRMA